LQNKSFVTAEDIRPNCYLMYIAALTDPTASISYESAVLCEIGAQRWYHCSSLFTIYVESKTSINTKHIQAHTHYCSFGIQNLFK